MNGTTWIVVGFLTLVVAERASATFSHRQLAVGEQRMRWSLYALYGSYSAVVGGTLVEHLITRRPLIPWVSAVGLLVYLGSFVLRTVAIRTLREFWSLQIEIRSEHRLIREGIYSRLRHPNYAAILLEVLSIPLVVNAWYALALALVTFLPLLLYRTHWEEAALVEKFGEAYRAYQREVGKLVPKWFAWGRRPGPRDRG
jgi:protein-S-isoprenylcysteine O-methyltransferase Ste14